jgi:hypothetical protein
MDITLTVEQGDGNVVAYATVTRDSGLPQRSCNVRVTVDGKGKKPSAVDKTATATVDLGKLKVGTHIVTAEVIGANPPCETRQTVTVKSARRATSWVEWLISGIFLILLLKYSYTTFTVIGMVVTMGILIVGASLENDREGFGHALWVKVSNNNWVYYTTLWLFVASLVVWLFSFAGAPLPELNPVKWAWGAVKDTVMPPPVDPWANDGFGGSITRFFLGEGGWGGATFSYMLWTLLARPVSFWDDWVARRKANQKDGKAGLTGGIIKFLLGDLAGSELWKFLGFKF